MDQKCYIIIYKLAVGVTDQAIDNAIRTYGTWAKITSDTWAIVTTQTATQIRENLERHVGIGGRIFVIKSGLEAAWRNVECSSEWLKRNL